MTGNNSYRTPEGYFDTLGSRLEAIAREPQKAPRRGRAYLALAASIVALCLLGSAFLRSVTPARESISVSVEEGEAFAQMVHSTGAIAFMMYEELVREDEDDAVSPEDVKLIKSNEDDDE